MNRKTRRAMMIAGGMMIILLIFNMMTSTPEAPTVPPGGPGGDTGGNTQVEKPPDENVRVVIAQMTIPKQKKITAEMVKVVEVPQSLKHTDAASDTAQVLNHYSLVNIYAKEQLLLQRLGESSSADVGMAYVIARGKRAMSIPMTEDRAVGGYISPGKFVDIIGTFRQGTASVTRAVLRKVKILAINEKYVIDKTGGQPVPAAPPATPPKEGEAAKAEGFQRIEGIQAITFEVTPDEGEKLFLASQNTQLALEIVHPDAPEGIELQPISNDQILQQMARKPGSPEGPTPGQPGGPGGPPNQPQLGPNGEIPMMNVQIIRGLSKESQSVPLNIPTTSVAGQGGTTGTTATAGGPKPTATPQK